MPTLNELSNLKKFVWIPAIILIVILLVGLVVYRYTQPAKPATTPAPPITFDSLPAANAGFNTQNLNPPQNTPQTLPIYLVSHQDPLTTSAASLAPKLGFTQNPEELNDINLGRGLAYSSQDASLVIYEDILTYQKFLDQTSLGSFEIQPLADKAASFLFQLNFPLPEQEPGTSYLKLSDESLTETSSENANFINFKFKYTLSGLPVEGNNPQTEIALDNQGNLIRLIYKQLTTTQDADSQIISYKEALNKLSKNQGFLINIEGEREDIKAIRSVGPVTLSEAYLAYYLPTAKSQNLNPVWIFKGTSEVNGEIIKSSYAVDAAVR